MHARVLFFLMFFGTAWALPSALKPLAFEEEAPPPPRPGAPPEKHIEAEAGGVLVEVIDGVACDGTWKWRVLGDKQRIRAELTDENRSPTRTSCAMTRHWRLHVRVPTGRYQVELALPPGHGTMRKTLFVIEPTSAIPKR